MGLDTKGNDGNFVSLMIKERVVNELIVKALLDEEIAAKKIKVSDEDVEDALKTIIDKVGSKEKFNELLQQNGVSAKQFKKDLTEEVKLKKLLTSVKTIKVSDSDAQKFYNKNKEMFKYPDRVRASHILISANKEELKKAAEQQYVGLKEAEIEKKVSEQLVQKEQKAKKLLSQLKADKSKFEVLAKTNSDDLQSAKNGGDLGFFAYSDMVEPFSKVAFSQKPNTISDLVKTPYGYHIIMVTDRAKAGVEPFEKVKDEIKTYLTNVEQVKVLQDYVEMLKKNASIRYIDESFNPENIQKKLKKTVEQNQSETLPELKNKNNNK